MSGRCNKLRVKEMVLLLNECADGPPSRVAPMAKRSLFPCRSSVVDFGSEQFNGDIAPGVRPCQPRSKLSAARYFAAGRYNRGRFVAICHLESPAIVTPAITNTTSKLEAAVFFYRKLLTDTPLPPNSISGVGASHGS